MDGSKSSSEEVKNVDVYTAKGLLSTGYRYLDVRTKEEFQKGHVEGALNIPYMFVTEADICSKAGISVRKKAPMGFSSETDKDLRPADLLLFNWVHGKDACVDVRGDSPFTGTRASSWAPGVSVANAVERKRKKCTTKCEENGYKFIPFAFSTFGELGEDTLDMLSRITSVAMSYTNTTQSRTYIFHRLVFSIQKGVGAQLVARLPTNFL